MHGRCYVLIALAYVAAGAAVYVQTVPFRLAGIVEVPTVFNRYGSDGNPIPPQKDVEIRTQPAVDSPVAATIADPNQLESEASRERERCGEDHDARADGRLERATRAPHVLASHRYGSAVLRRMLLRAVKARAERQSSAQSAANPVAYVVLEILDGVGPLHGFGIARRIEHISGNVLAVNQGTLSHALSITAEAGARGSDRVRVGHLREQPQSPFLPTDARRTPTAAGGNSGLGADDSLIGRFCFMAWTNRRPW